MKILEKRYGYNCVEAANALNNLGLIYNKIGNLLKSEEFYLRSLKLLEKNFGINSI